MLMSDTNIHNLEVVVVRIPAVGRMIESGNRDAVRMEDVLSYTRQSKTRNVTLESTQLECEGE
jgi:hypothetical protein